jgi:hypothetical protein
LRFWKVATFAALGSMAFARPALAGGMDPTPERLVLQPPNIPGGFNSCQSIANDPQGFYAATAQLPNNFSCRPDNAAYANMMAELGFAMAPTAFHPGRTTGIGGFALTFESSFTKINSGGTTPLPDGSQRAYWKEGTRGSTDPNTKQFSIINNSPDSMLQIYSLKARKGLPFGFEAAGALGFMANTSLWVGGADIRWSILEGFRTGALGYLPDISVGGGVRTVTGSSKFYLTTVGIDAQISKPFALADTAVLTPYIGYQRLLIFADSTIVDTTPNVDAVQQCGYRGQRVNDPDPTKNTGAPDCINKITGPGGVVDNNSDFNNNITFSRVRVHRHRGIVGVTYKYELLYLAGQFATDLTAPSDENPFLVGGRQWTMSLEAGVYF